MYITKLILRIMNNSLLYHNHNHNFYNKTKQFCQATRKLLAFRQDTRQHKE